MSSFGERERFVQDRIEEALKKQSKEYGDKIHALEKEVVVLELEVERLNRVVTNYKQAYQELIDDERIDW